MSNEHELVGRHNDDDAEGIGDTLILKVLGILGVDVEQAKANSPRIQKIIAAALEALEVFKQKSS